jgi:hypothetical protein
MRLADLACVVRSKNAGPATLTLDVMFADAEGLARALGAPALTASAIAARYGVAADAVRVIAYAPACALKFVLPRRPAGGPGDRDTYGAQAHHPLLDIEI